MKPKQHTENRNPSSATPEPSPKSVYTPEHLSDLNFRFENDLGAPGAFPFTRGIHPQMYRRRAWTMRQYAGYGSAIESNSRYRYLLSQGQSGLSVAFDLPTQIGLDSDHVQAEGEVGKVGVAIDSLEDMEVLFKGISLDKVSTSMTINATAAILLALYVALAKKQSIAISDLSGTIQNDILKEYVARGTYIYPPNPSLRLTTDIFAFCCEEMPNWNMISVSGYHMREAGSTAAQELAFTLAHGITYTEAALARGLQIDQFAPRISFFFNSHNHILEEVAKFRAARRLWAHLMRDRFGAQNPRSWMLRFHAQTAGSTLTAQQPDNNLVRVTLQALAAVLGGAQSLHTNSRDEALGLPTEHSALLALRTQQIIAFESGITNTIDPLGGSYYVESLTTSLEKQVEQYLEKIENLGGAIPAIAAGFMQREIQDSSFRTQRAIESENQITVGVNRFGEQKTASPPILRVDPKIEQDQKARLERLRSRRNSRKVEISLQQVKEAARGEVNLLPSIINAVENYATVGEISDALRQVFGLHQESVVI